MGRGLTVAQNALIKSRIFGAAMFVELLSPTPIRIWTGVGTIVVGANTWLGVGEFGVIDGIESSRELRGSALSVGLYGLPSDAVPAGAIAGTRGQSYQYDVLNTYLGLFTADTNALVDGLISVWAGSADVLSFKSGREVSAMLSGEHLTSKLRRPNGLRAACTFGQRQRAGERVTGGCLHQHFLRDVWRVSGGGVVGLRLRRHRSWLLATLKDKR